MRLVWRDSHILTISLYRTLCFWSPAPSHLIGNSCIVCETTYIWIVLCFEENSHIKIYRFFFDADMIQWSLRWLQCKSWTGQTFIPGAAHSKSNTLGWVSHWNCQAALYQWGPVSTSQPSMFTSICDASWPHGQFSNVLIQPNQPKYQTSIDISGYISWFGLGMLNSFRVLVLVFRHRYISWLKMKVCVSISVISIFPKHLKMGQFLNQN